MGESRSRSPYRPHPGPHTWSLAIPQLAGKRACRDCGHIAKGREDVFAIRRALRKKETL